MKKAVKGIIAIVAIVAVGFGIIQFKDYYQGRYVESHIVYVKVPSDQETDLVQLYYDNGDDLGKGRRYVFTGYTEQGEAREVDFTFQTENESDLLQPGQYVKVSSSDILVLGQEVIPEVNVPANVLRILNP